jgi:hypothetical protein
MYALDFLGSQFFGNAELSLLGIGESKTLTIVSQNVA